MLTPKAAEKKPIAIMRLNEKPATAVGFAIWPVITFGLAGAAMFNLAPIYLATQARRLDLDDRQVGWLMSIEIAGIAIAALVIVALWRQLDLHRVALIGASSILLGNLVSPFIDSVIGFFATRFLTGLFGDGFAYAAAIATLGRHHHPVRAFATLSFTNMCVTAVGLSLLPLVHDEWRGTAVLGVFSVFALIALGAWHRYPRLVSSAASDQGRWTARLPKTHLFGLLGLMAFTANLGSVWSYVERIGESIGISAVMIGILLSLSILSQAIGSLLALFGSHRITPRTALIAVAISQALGLSLLAIAENPWHLGIALCFWGASWNFGLANLLGIIANMPDSSPALSSAPAVEAMGVSIGPLLVGAVLHYGAQTAVTAIAAFSVLICITCFAYVHRLFSQPAS